MQHNRLLLLPLVLGCLIVLSAATISMAQEGLSLFAQGSQALNKDKNPQAAYGLFSQCAAQGDARCMFGLSRLLMRGQGAPKDEALAMDWLGRSAEAGYAPAQNVLGVYHVFGSHGLAQDSQLGMQWMAQAANQNYCGAAIGLALLIGMGEGTPHNPELANQWLAQARQMGCKAPDAVQPLAPYKPTKAEVAEVQRNLTALGFDPGPVDGLYGKRTAEAIRAFQAQQGMAADGAVSQRLIQRLAQTANQ